MTFAGPILVTGATGQQGGAVVRALLASPSPPIILAVTRDATSASAQKLAAKSSKIKLVQGNLNDVPALFESALKQADSIAGVFSVQLPAGMGVTEGEEVSQGKAMVDASLSHGVKHFVYGSVDRGGDKSWDNPSNVPHFQTKHQIERHLRDSAKGKPMTWTILRPVAYFDNLIPAFQTKVFLAAIKVTMGNQPIQWIAVKDIGIFVAKALASPEQYHGRAISLAGDELGIDEVSKTFGEVTGTPVVPTFGIFGSLLRLAMKEMRLMLDFFKDPGFGADIASLKKEHPGLLDLKTWIKEESKFEIKK